MIQENLHEVEQHIAESRSKRAANVHDEDVLLVAVTKNHDVEAMREAIDAGAGVVGENRVQEAMDKYEPSVIGFRWDDTSPRIQLEPRGERGYIELRAVKKI